MESIYCFMPFWFHKNEYTNIEVNPHLKLTKSQVSVSLQRLHFSSSRGLLLFVVNIIMNQNVPVILWKLLYFNNDNVIIQLMLSNSPSFTSPTSPWSSPSSIKHSTWPKLLSLHKFKRTPSSNTIKYLKNVKIEIEIWNNCVGHS